MLLEDAFDSICRLKFKVCEIFINTISETKINFLKDIKSKASDSGIKIASIHPFFSGYEDFMFFSSSYRRRTFDCIKLYDMFFEAAQFLGSDYIIFHGMGPGPREIRCSVEEYAETFLLIAEEAKQYGVELLHENIGTVNYYIKDLIKISPDIRFTLDFKHAISRGFTVPDIIDAMGKNIAHIHFNDMNMQNGAENVSKTEMCRLPFFGNLNYFEIFAKLSDIKYIGNFIIEVYRNNYTDETEISESVNRFIQFINL
jgi:sugar phosphate isomerase/epimerase